MSQATSNSKLSASGAKLDAIACNQATASWLVFANLKTDFPALDSSRVMQPRSHQWPNFLKRDNLLNIANHKIAVIAAVVVGGASLSGGSGRMFGTLIGALTIAVSQNGMNLTNVESYTQKVVLGLVILVAVMLDLLRRRGRSGKLLANE